LKRLPIDEIKIDRAFVKDLRRDESDRRIVQGTISLGHDLGLQAVAEGVEDAEMHALLTSWGCDIAQGYFLSRPLPAEDCIAWIKQHEARRRRPLLCVVDART
jgi:EAL domain-containing protein (putative c-di-GMP-specific phosphodiesterase class I)